ncbi:MAG: hypothetical protein JRJ03_09080 [Deltaproteobacteria bacterium]|nr:hypothetical protein [Deltaproteobacteria bacterium]
MRYSYFTFGEWVFILLFALCGALMNVFFPTKEFLAGLEMTEPVKGMSLFGGFFFVMWVYLGRRVTQKRYGGLATAILLVSFCLFLSPWYGVISPWWFSFYGLVALFVCGTWIELSYESWDWLGGGLANLFCLGITWLAFGFHQQMWPDARGVPLALTAVFISGVAGIFSAKLIGQLAAAIGPKSSSILPP